MVIVAAPSYLAAHGYPEHVGDLKHHTAILTRKHLDHWDIDGETVRVSWRISTGNAAVTRNAVRTGLGIGAGAGVLRCPRPEGWGPRAFAASS